MVKIAIQDVASKLIVQNGLSKKEATRFANKMFDLIREALEEEKTVKVKGLGTFKIIDVDSRESVNVNTGERVLIEGHNKITFTPDALMKELVNKPFSQFETIVLNDGVDFKDPSEEELEQETLEAEELEVENDNMPLVDFVSEEKPVEPEKPASSEMPIVEPEPLLKPVSVVESEPSVEPEPVAELEPVVGPEPSAEQEPVVEPEPSVVEPEPAADPEPIAEPETAEEDDDTEYVEDDEEQPADRKWILWLLACLLALVAGYLLGSYLPLQSLTASKESVSPKVENTEVKKASEVKKKPEVKKVPEAEKPEIQKEPEVQKEPEANKQPETPKQPEVKAPAEEKTPEVVLDKYEAKDSRVRTGAYRIVGTDYVETVREGDNLTRISKRTLGEGMECYIEVYNDLKASSELKKGQEIKIPKLELKKKKSVKK